MPGLGESKVHLGPRTAGNKSLLSYRAGHGITGYVGFCPSSESIPIPVKEGPSSIPGAEADRTRAQPSFVLHPEVEGRESTYGATINKSPTAKAGAPRGAQTFPVRSFGDLDAPAVPNQPFIADSLYRSSIGIPPSKSKEAKDHMPFLSSPTRKKPAYLSGSTYSSSYDNSMELVHGQAWLENKEPRTVQSVYGSLWKEVIVQPAGLVSSYTQDYGTFGEGTIGKTLQNPMDQSMEATTSSLFAGSPKGFKRVPGYQGFLPEHDLPENIMAQSMDHDRKATKNMCLFTLQQLQQNVPGTGIILPREADNMNKFGKGKAGTTTFFNNQFLDSPAKLATIARKRAETKQHGNTAEMKKLFSPGALQQSDNGYANAERFYKLFRPYEGAARIQLASSTTESGYKFTTYTSKV